MNDEFERPASAPGEAIRVLNSAGVPEAHSTPTALELSQAEEIKELDESLDQAVGMANDNAGELVRQAEVIHALLEAIRDDAPHGHGCSWLVWIEGSQSISTMEPECNCWKSRALAQIRGASPQAQEPKP